MCKVKLEFINVNQQNFDPKQTKILHIMKKKSLGTTQAFLFPYSPMTSTVQTQAYWIEELFTKDELMMTRYRLGCQDRCPLSSQARIGHFIHNRLSLRIADRPADKA